MCRFIGSNIRRIQEHLKHEYRWDLGLKPNRAPVVTNNRHNKRL